MTREGLLSMHGDLYKDTWVCIVLVQTCWQQHIPKAELELSNIAKSCK